MRFLNYDSPFMNFLRKIVDYVYLGILWFFVSLPVVTFGAGLTAALQTAERVLRNEEGTITRTFFGCFRKEFKQATLLWLLQIPILVVLVLDVWLLRGSNLTKWLRVMILVATGVVFCWLQLWFGYQSKFVDKIKTILSNSFRMLLGSLGGAFILGVLALAAILGMLISFIYMPPLFFVIPGIYLMLYSPIANKLFSRYLPKAETEEEDPERSAETENTGV